MATATKKRRVSKKKEFVGKINRNTQTQEVNHSPNPNKVKIVNFKSILFFFIFNIITGIIISSTFNIKFDFSQIGGKTFIIPALFLIVSLIFLLMIATRLPPKTE